MRGRKPLPSKIIDIRGGSKLTHRPSRTGEPEPPAVIPKCPSFLDKEAKKEWRRMAKELYDLGMITRIDRAVLAKYCESYSQWAQASRKIQAMGMIYKTPGKISTVTLKNGTVKQTQTGGFPMINPYFSIANRAKEQMEKSAIEMGCTPSSRSRVRVSEPPKEENKKERFFR
jgi:P27 family predicted phage terminase small subunit